MKTRQILLDHGSGGRLSHELITGLMLPAFDNAPLSELHDGARLDIAGMRLAFSTDSYVVDPIFFPGGDIGVLSVNGTVNDLAMCGAAPLFLSAGLIIEEGFCLDDLDRIIASMTSAAKNAGVTIVTGDTKVVPAGTADKIFINTSGIGLIPEGIIISGDRAQPGDKVIISGPIADHGVTILVQRKGMEFESDITSDTTPLNHMVGGMLSSCPDIHVLRDPTRGGVGTSLNEIAERSRVGIKLYEDKIPIRAETAGICELLGLDPLYIANEGKLLAFVRPEHVNRVLSVMKKHHAGKDACLIGEVISDSHAKVIMRTRIGGTRIVDMPAGEQLPRIC
ncbi:carbamoyl phosphate phosphatase, hydrogenase 3 maturation protein [uncultured Desulfobacterium sp.]|uniref:Carbamoyl phosphate phosphatase, hydrogenase 3 maturation protein n=1 Tax=uncultured Desulfobacterium sp. TaxID=201089 RepID=A0A445MUB9_9BACT|nr:carbamoyl phosphate phosphatase, hydrogenase 3 maturation protein [uncultured Desulfobacterium sp.]